MTITFDEIKAAAKRCPHCGRVPAVEKLDVRSAGGCTRYVCGCHFCGEWSEPTIVDEYDAMWRWDRLVEHIENEAAEEQPAPAILPAVSLEALGRFERGDMCERCLRMMQETPAQREYCAACGGRA